MGTSEAEDVGHSDETRQNQQTSPAIIAWDIYGPRRRPTSGGRVLLADVLENVMEETCGLGPGGIAGAFDADGSDRSDERASIRSFLTFLGNLVQQGELSTWVRPFGGGEISSFPASRWEIDDFEARFATSAVDPVRWADPNAAPTHWIFVSESSFEAWWNSWNAEEADEQGPSGLSIAIERTTSTPGDERSSAGLALLKRSEVSELTGMSRSTIYDKIRKDGFPAPVQLGRRMSRWRSHEVDAWMMSKISP
jgi:prophage regulatory protein